MFGLFVVVTVVLASVSVTETASGCVVCIQRWCCGFGRIWDWFRFCVREMCFFWSRLSLLLRFCDVLWVVLRPCFCFVLCVYVFYYVECSILYSRHMERWIMISEPKKRRVARLIM